MLAKIDGLRVTFTSALTQFLLGNLFVKTHVRITG